MILINPQHLSEEYTYTRQHEDGDGQPQKGSPGATNRGNRLLPSELQREMVEVCLDMLARYTFASMSSQITRYELKHILVYTVTVNNESYMEKKVFAVYWILS